MTFQFHTDIPEVCCYLEWYQWVGKKQGVGIKFDKLKIAMLIYMFAHVIAN